MPLHPAGHRVIFSMSQKRMVTIWARFVWFFFKLHLGNQNVHFLLLQFLACRCEIRSSEIHTEDKKFRQTEKLLEKALQNVLVKRSLQLCARRILPFCFQDMTCLLTQLVLTMLAMLNKTCWLCVPGWHIYFFLLIFVSLENTSPCCV